MPSASRAWVAGSQDIYTHRSGPKLYNCSRNSSEHPFLGGSITTTVLLVGKSFTKMEDRYSSPDSFFVTTSTGSLDMKIASALAATNLQFVIEFSSALNCASSTAFVLTSIPTHTSKAFDALRQNKPLPLHLPEYRQKLVRLAQLSMLHIFHLTSCELTYQ